MSVRISDLRLAKRRNKRPPWDDPPTKAGQATKALVLGGAVLAVLVPLWSVLITSLSSRQTINEAGGMVFIPKGLDFSAYQTIFDRGDVSRAVWVSTMVAVVGTAVSLTCTVLAAYGLSRPGSMLHRTFLFWILLTFLIGPGLVPSYLVVTGLGLKNSIWALILPGAVSAFNMVVVRAFFMNIPREIIDSARIDGASEWRVLWQITLPLSKAVVAVIGLFYAVGYWNAYFNAVLYMTDTRMRVVQQVLQSYILAGQAPTIGTVPGMQAPPSLAVKMAVVVIVLVPVVIIYPFIQRHFTKGVIIGAVKG